MPWINLKTTLVVLKRFIYNHWRFGKMRWHRDMWSSVEFAYFPAGCLMYGVYMEGINEYECEEKR